MQATAPMAKAFVVTTLLALSSGQALAAAGDLMSTNKVNVNIRNAPSTNADVVTTINPDDTLIELSAKGDWYFIEVPEQRQQGWVFAPLVQPLDGPKADLATAQPARVTPAPAGVEQLAPRVIQANPTPTAPEQPAPRVIQANPSPEPAREALAPLVIQANPSPEPAREAPAQRVVQANPVRTAPEVLRQRDTPRGFPSDSTVARLEARLTTFDPSIRGNPQRGETVFYKCGSCHTSVPGIHAQGPSLHGIFGQRPASSSEFRYSSAMEAFAREGAVWDEATLDRFIQRPTRVVKGTSMPFSGVRDAQDRRDLIVYLQQLRF